MKFKLSIKSSLVLFLLSFSLFSCVQKTETEKADKTQMDEIESRIEILKESMISYMHDAEPDYTEKDVAECENILNQYLIELQKTNSREAGMKVVESTVMKLNKLNEKCDLELIETGEREQIAEIIILASSKKGYNSVDEDITEQWREW